MFIKICGITRASDASHAVAHGATAVGFVFWPRSPRYIAPAAAAEIVAVLPPGVTAVGVFVNQALESILETVARAGISMVQLHGDEPPAFAQAVGHPVLRASSIDEAAGGLWPVETTLLLDAADPVRRGGTGQTIDWGRAAEIASRRPIVLAGGLTPENVAEAISHVRPFGVDVSSGVEVSPGVKSADKVSRFLAEARRAFESVQGRG